MFWIFLFLIGVALLILSIILDDENIYRILSIAPLIFGCFASLIVIFGGATDYPYLLSKKAEIVAYRNRIEDIKNAKYAYKTDGQFVAGSIENIKQSEVLSNYIKNVADKEAEYMGYLQKCKTYRETTLLRWFGDGWFISEKINTLPDKP
jgi:hypothetical protein